MATPQPVDGLDPRRTYSRLELGIPARLETLEGRQVVRLVDLSQGGAHLILSRPERVREGVLAWLRFDTFGVVVWQRGVHLGLEFDQLVPRPFLVETRLRAPAVVREAAEEWVTGTVPGH